MDTTYEHLASLFEGYVQESARLKQSLESVVTENAQLKLRLNRSEAKNANQGRAFDDLIRTNKKQKAELAKLRQQVEEISRARNSESLARKRLEKESVQLKTELESTKNVLHGVQEAVGWQAALSDSTTATQQCNLPQVNIAQDFVVVLVDGGKFSQFLHIHFEMAGAGSS